MMTLDYMQLDVLWHIFIIFGYEQSDSSRGVRKLIFLQNNSCFLKHESQKKPNFNFHNQNQFSKQQEKLLN